MTNKTRLIIENLPAIIADFKEGVDRKVICSRYGLAPKTLSTHLAKNGLVRERGFLMKNAQEIVIRYENGDSMASIAASYQTDASAVKHVLNKSGIVGRSQSITSRRYVCNEDFFDVLDSEEKAYFLGMLYADGYNNQKEYSIILALKAADKDHLEKLNKLIFPDRPLLANRQNEHPQFRLSINSKHMSSRLAELGCWQNKTQTLTYPRWIDKNLEPHFIRGFFDGDGSIYMNKATGSAGVKMVASNGFCKELALVLERELGITSRLNIDAYEGVSELYFHSNEKARRFATYLYEASTLHLDRKKERFDILFSGAESVKQEYMKTFKGIEHKPRLKGSDNPQSKLTEGDVIEIRGLFAIACPLNEIARRYKVGRSCIESIKYGRTWKS